ncbi:ROK family protein [Nonomuraea sp. NN258]|uniref:ROK family protein n=1 Tax=Nonomuraea antri TaxID=2730852 RepID=UPI001568DCE5|nr:ROK family protein [Nonomuraea antri]NRQ33481.1 ROK family protein [Nonomuraea antri]
MNGVLGIDVGGTKVAVGVSETDGPSFAARVRLDSGPDALARALAAARELNPEPAAVGFSTCGIVRDGVVRLAPNVPGWEGLELPRLLGEAYGGTPVAIDNDVNAAARAELRWGALRGVSTGVYVNLGTGLAAALVIGGEVVAGAHGAAGEIGYLQVTPGEPAFADGRVPLEERVSGGGLAARAGALLGRETTTEELLTRQADGARTTGSGSAEVRELVEEALATLAMTVANLCVTVDPERVVIGGGMMGAAELIMPRITAEVRRAVPFPPEVRPAVFTDDAPLLGALALAHSLHVRER